MKKIILMAMLLSLVGCQDESISYNKGTMAGPRVTCPVKSIPTSDFCFAKDIKTLVEHGKIISEVKWLISNKQISRAESLLTSAFDFSTDHQELKLALVDVYIRQSKWVDAKFIIDELNIAVNDSLRLIVEARTGRYSEGTDLNLLPQIYKNQMNGVEPLRAIVKPDYQTYFELTRVDTAERNVSSMEPSIIVSDNGQNILVAWMEDINFPSMGQYLPKGRSAFSSDGGNSWSNFNAGTEDEDQHLFDFDLITAYDPNNNFMYTSGATGDLTMVNGVESPDWMFVYRRDLNSGTQSGPFIITGDESPFLDYDKTLIAINDEGELWMTTYFPGNVKSSDDFGETFVNENTIPSGMAQPKFRDGCLYLLSQTSPKIWRCDLNDDEGITTPASDNWWGYGDKVPGEFQVHNLTYMDFHPNGDLFIIFSELKEVNSDELVIWMSKSSDNGDTWDDAWIVTPDFPGDKFLPWIEIDELGGIHISYNDTRNNVQDDNSTVTYLDMYYSYSSDLGQSWLETRVTPRSFELIDDVSYRATYSDYNEMSVGNPDAVFLSFPYSPLNNDMDMYVAKKFKLDDLIYKNGFE